MIKVIMCGHGDIACSMKNSVEMIFGKADALLPITFEKGECPADIEQKITPLISEHDEVLIVTDFFGGSPFNVSSKLALAHQNVEAITGMSLPLCLEVMSNIDDLSLSDLANYLVKVGANCVKKFNKAVILETEEDFI